jgi:cyclase
MLKKRIIFTLLYQNKSFYLSRNFRLQKIGNLDWLKKNYDFSILTKSVDEIIILNVSREKNQIEDFSKAIKKFSKECFLPISAGGKIIDIDVAKKYISSGADKLVVNTNLFNKILIKEIASTFGAQCVIGSIDYIKKKNNFDIYINNGKEKSIKKIKLVFEYLEKMPIGEILLNSIDQDGTGNGFDFDILKHVPKNFIKPVILSGGAGNYKHILKALKNKKVDSIATANLLNFVGNGLQEARYLLMRNGVKLAEWI